MGNGAPTIGSRPKTIEIFTNTYRKIAEAKPKQYNFEKKLLTKKPILITR